MAQAATFLSMVIVVTHCLGAMTLSLLDIWSCDLSREVFRGKELKLDHQARLIEKLELRSNIIRSKINSVVGAQSKYNNT